MGWRLAKLTTALLGGGVLVLVASGFLAFSGSPSVAFGSQLTPDLVSRAQELLRAHNPRRLRGQQPRVAELSGGDVSLLASYVASRYGLSAAVDIAEGAASVRASVPVSSPFGSYLNLSATIPDAQGVPRLTHATLGTLPVPDSVANWAVGYAVRRWAQQDPAQLATDVIRSVSMHDGTVFIEYQWRPDAADRMRALAVPTADAERLRAYHERTVAAMRDLPADRRSMLDLLLPLLDLARTRSAAGNDAVVENRAALIAAAFYVNGVDMAAVVADAEQWPRARRRTLLLRGRNDLSKHFLVSAVLTATAGTPLSDVVGLSKEIDDSRGGSGFSFSDIAADRAGTAFGALAVTPDGTFQVRTRPPLEEAALMPDIEGLADNMPEPEFLKRFGGVGAPEYTRVLADIDRRIAACPVYRRP